MTGLVEQITAFVAGHSTLAYGAIFLIAAAEAFPVLGAILPGSVAIVGLAALIPSGALALWPMLIAALLGAILGDGVSYWLGHRYRETLLGTWPFSRVSSLVKGNEAIFASHGFKSIFIGRFTPARSIVPVAAGIAGMPVRRFYVANILSAVAWALAHVLPGALLGTALSVLGAVAGRLVVLAAVVLLVCWLVLLAVRWLLRRLTPLLAGVQTRLALQMRYRPGRWRAVVLALLDPERPGTQLTLPLLVLPLLGVWLGIVVLGGVAERTGADAAVAALFGSLRTSWADAALGDIALVLGFAASLVAVLVLLWLLARRLWRTAVWWSAGVLLALLLAGWTAAPAEDLAWFGVLGQQAGPLAVLFGLLAVLCAREIAPRPGAILVAAGALAVALSALADLYFNGAPLSRLLTGLAVAMGGIGVLGLVHLARPARLLHAPALLGAVAALLALGGAALAAAGPDYTGPPRPAPVTRAVTADAWWSGGWTRLPARRADLGGELDEPFTLQWAGTLQELATRLALQGWSTPPVWTWRAALAWAEPEPRPVALPILPQLHEGLPPLLTLVRPDNGCAIQPCLLVLRLWRSGTELLTEGRGPQPVLLGSAARKHLTRPLPLLTVAIAERDMNGPRDAVAHALGTGQLRRRPDSARDAGWDGQVLLASQPAGSSISQ